MAKSLNRVTLMGRLGRDPEVRTFPNGGTVCNFRLATSDTWTDRATGEKRERTEWHSIAIFNEGLVRIAERYLEKGDLVYIEGRLETREWSDQSGAKRYATEVVLRPYNGDLYLIPTGRSDGGAGAGGGSGYGASASSSPGPARSDIDDEIPF